jgi:hypothetical protein
MLAKVGEQTPVARGLLIPPTVEPSGALRVALAAQGEFYEDALAGRLYSLMMSATTTNTSAGNILGAAAAASTQFALWNPAGTGFNLELLRFSLNISSGTSPISGLWHSVASPAPTIAPALAATSYCGNHNPLITGTQPGVAGYLTHVTGAALTGGGATRGLRLMGLNITAGTYASLGGTWFIDDCRDIVLPPNSLWVPSWAAQGTTMIGGYSITWRQKPI